MDLLQKIGDWLMGLGPYLWHTLAWCALLTGALAGLAGVIIPVIPGAVVLWVAAFLHKLMLPDFLSWWTIGGLTLLVAVDRLADFAGMALGTKWFGGTKWGIWGALIGGLVGLFFGFIGIFVGPIIGAVAFELIWARSHPRAAARSGMGAGVGFGLSAVGRFVVCVIMLATILLDLLARNEPPELAPPLDPPLEDEIDEKAPPSQPMQARSFLLDTD